MTTPRQARGSSLLLAMMVIFVLSVIAVAAIRLGTSQVAGATAGAKRAALTQCADAATRLLLSKFHTLGVHPDQISVLNAPLDGAAGQVRAVGGHIDSAAPPAGTPGVTIGQVVYLPEGAFGPPQATDDSNVLRLTGQGGRPMKITVHCVDHGDGTPTGGRQLEVELGIRFGL